MSSFSSRVASVDILRGIVMIIMALDHTRDYFSGFPYSPTDLEHTNAAMFFTRWITHYCAPVFVFLSGTSAYFSLSRGKTKKQASLQLLTRGFWLILLELTIVRFGWQFNLDYNLVFVQVIWAIGWSMIFLSAMIFLPFRAILTVSLLMIFGHNLFDGIHPDDFGGIWWNLLHAEGAINYGDGNRFYILYPLIPWVGVMSAGYCFGRLFKNDNITRNKQFHLIGTTGILSFLLLRWLNVYGDPSGWISGEGQVSVLSFLNTTKYPPSLLFLFMTLGPAILLLPLLDRLPQRIGNFLAVYGRVPLFYYILHIYLLHTMALVLAMGMGIPASQFTSNGFQYARNGWGFDLPAVYGFWLIAILLLYLPCRWFMRIKQQHKKWWLSYL